MVNSITSLLEEGADKRKLRVTAIIANITINVQMILKRILKGRFSLFSF